MRTPFKSIRTEITVVIVITGILVGIGVGFFIYRETINRAIDAARSRIETTMAFVKASRNYVRKTLRPKVYELLAAGCTDQDFILEAQSSSFFTASIFNMVNREIPDMELRQVAINPLNPKDRPNETEMWVIAYLKSKNLKEYEGITFHRGKEYYIKAFAVIPKKSCLRCHGTVDAMPVAVRNIYKPKTDPKWPVGKVNGAVIVYVPFEKVMAKARIDGLVNGGLVGGVFILMSGIILVILNFRVFKPIEVLRNRAEKISKGDIEEPIPYQSENEIGRLARAIERMRVSLKKVMDMIG
ncbi:c-type heme family protein [Hydrogenivirga sp.]